MKQEFSTGHLLRRIISFAKPFRKHLVKVFLCILAITAVNALISLLLSHIATIVQEHAGDMKYIAPALWLAGGATLLRIVRIALNGWQGRIEVYHLDLIIPNYLNRESIEKFFSFSNGQHINEHSGVKQSIVNNGTASIKSQIDLIIYQFFPAVSAFLISLCVLWYASWAIGLFFLGVAGVFIAMMYQHNKKTVPGIRKIRDQKILNSRLISDMFRFVTLVKNESQEKRSLGDVDDAQNRYQGIFVETWIPGINRLQWIRGVSSLSQTIVIFGVIYLIFKNQITLGAYFLFLMYSSSFIDSLWQLTNLHRQFLMDRTNIEKYFEMLEVKSDIAIAENPIKVEPFFGRIEFKNVSFWYPRRVKSYEDTLETTTQEEPVLKQVSFTINPGEKVGIVGESGSGKSTLANLIRRGFDPQQGQILVDGNDLRLVDLKHFLQQVGSVEQEVVLFDRSMRDNILFGLNGKAKTFSDEQLHELAKLARIDGFFSRLEHGFDTIVGEKGVKLSGGERQRVGIARALAKNPSILIFDEATSALDAMSERIVQQSIDDAANGKTAIIIAHRLSTVKNCDKILVFRHGILLAQGSHEQLLDSCEYYAELVRHQMVAA